MATSIAQRVGFKVSLRLRCCSTIKGASLHTSCVVAREEGSRPSGGQEEGSRLSGSQPEGSRSSGDETKGSRLSSGQRAVSGSVVRVGQPAVRSTKAQTISRAMLAYMQRAQEYDAMIKKEIDEYNIGKRHLANIMGRDPDMFEQQDIDAAIEYLLPSGIFDKKARPSLKHPYEVFPKRKAAQFGLDGRPFHSMFYTGKPNLYSLMLTISLKLEDLKREEDRLVLGDGMAEQTDKKLMLFGSEWITAMSLKDMLLENILEHDHKCFMILMERLATHPLSYREEEFIMKYRRKLNVESFTTELAKPQTDESGRTYIEASARRKRSTAQVTMWPKGSGQFSINGQSVQYFPNLTQREVVMSPLQFTGRLGQVDVEARVEGGGVSGQAGAVRLALSKTLATVVDAETQDKMHIAGLLSHDPRRRERKKPGQKKARKKFTWKKR